jgi:N-acetylneuraminic acid mutarotase
MSAPILLAASLLVITAAGCGDGTAAPDGPPAAPTATPGLAAAPGTWIMRADLTSNQQKYMAAASVTNAAGQTVMYVIGGMNGSKGEYSKVYAYDAATDRWSRKADLPVPVAWSNGAAVIDGRIYLSGGESQPRVYSSALFVYDPASNRWSAKRSMPAAGLGGVSGAINGKLYVLSYCGGEDCIPLVPQAFYRYDPAADRWTTLPQPSAYHFGGSAGVIGAKFYVAGGDPEGTDVEAYDPTTNTWTSRAPLGSPRWGTAGAVAGGKLYVLGGFRADPAGATLVPTTSVYDPMTNTWTHRARMPVLLSHFAAARVVVNGTARIEVVGGPAPGNNLQLTP